MDIVIGITGATGSIYAVKLLEVLKDKDINTQTITNQIT